jgi:hypothetical protein
MNVTVEIPDEVAGRLNAAGGGDLARQVLEGYALEQYRSGRLNETELQKLLGFGTRYKLDGFLKAKGILVDDYTVADLRGEVATLRRLGF